MIYSGIQRLEFELIKRWLCSCAAHPCDDISTQLSVTSYIPHEMTPPDQNSTTVQTVGVSEDNKSLIQ